MNSVQLEIIMISNATITLFKVTFVQNRLEILIKFNLKVDRIEAPQNVLQENRSSGFYCSVYAVRYVLPFDIIMIFQMTHVI